MEKRLFETGDLYHICEDCGAWVPADRYKCDECGGDFSPTAMLYTFSQEERPKETEDAPEEPEGAVRADIRQEALHLGGPVMRCTSCGKRFAFGLSTCPDCGGTAVPELSGEDTDGERGGDIVYFYTAYLYDDCGRRSRANHAVKLKEGENLLGRNSFLLDPRLFFTAAELTQRIRERYSGISRENVILTLEKDRLTVRYAGEGKSPIRINGNTLREGGSAVLEEGDLLHFGDDDSEGLIEVEIGRRVDALGRIHRTLEAIQEDTRESRQQLGRIEEGTANIHRNMEEVLRGQEALQEAMRKITPDKLRVQESDREEEAVWEIYETEGTWQIRKCEGERDSYTERLETLMPKGEAEEVIRKTIQDFLTRREGDVSQEYYGQVERSLASHQFQLYLYQAAFFEGSCDNIYRTAGVEDYAAPLSFLGKAMEEFICTEYVRIIFESQMEGFQTFLAEKGKRMGGYLPQGLLVQYLGLGTRDTEDDTAAKMERVRKIVEKAGYSGADEARVNELKDAADKIGEMTQIRNKAVHAKASGSMANLRASTKYMKKSQRAVSMVITRKEYEQEKWKIFEGGALKLMHGYYEEICVKASAARRKGGSMSDVKSVHASAVAGETCAPEGTA